MTCPHCHESARFVGLRSKHLTSLVGPVHLSRPYYHCTHCRHGLWPWDELLRLSAEKLTPAAQEVVTLHGILNSFGKAADQALEKSAGLRLSESTVQRTTETAGERLGTWLHEGEIFGPTTPFPWHRDHEGKTCAYVSLDATGILMQGAQGAKADGRMVELGMIFNPLPREAEEDDEVSRPCKQVRYLAGHYTLPELGEQMRRQGAQVGMDGADVWIALTDAGQGLEHFIDVYFPRAVKIVDFRHASEYVHAFATASLAGNDGESLAARWCHRLKHEGGSMLLAEWRKCDRAAMAPAAQSAYDKAMSYFGNHVGRMDYPRYRSKGWQIGTGCVESACKRLVNQRLSMGGMRWGEAGSDAVCHLRALHGSAPDQWDAFWSHSPKPKEVNHQMPA